MLTKQEWNIFRVGNAIMSSSDIGYHDSSGGSPAAPQQENSQNKGNELFVYFRVVVYFTKLIFFPRFSVPISKFFPQIYKTIYLGFITLLQENK